MTLFGKKLILTDDDIHCQSLIEQTAHMLDCVDFEICTDTSTAISKFELLTYDFLILDMNINKAIDLIDYLFKKQASLAVLIYSSNIDKHRLNLFKYSNHSMTIKYFEKTVGNTDITTEEMIEISSEIKDCLEIHSCKETKIRVESLEDEIKEMKENTIPNIALDITKEFLSINRAKIMSAVGLLCAALFTYYMELIKVN